MKLFTILGVLVAALVELASAAVAFSDISPFAEADPAVDLNDLSLRLKSYLANNKDNGIDENYIWVQAKLGLTLQEIDLRRTAPAAALRQEALTHLQGAVTMAGDFDEITADLHFFWRVRLSILLHSMGRPEEARGAAEAALEVASSDADRATALYHLGDNWLMLGDASQALDCFREALALAPERLTMYRDVVRCHKQLKSLSKLDWFVLLEEIEASLKRNHERGQLESNNEIFWVLHQVAEEAELFQEAWAFLVHAREAEAARRSTWGEVYDSEGARKKVKLIKEAFHEGFWPAAATGIGSQSLLPVFIVGIPRSGSTLLESILVTHKDISTVREDSALAGGVGALQEEEKSLRELYLSAEGAAGKGRFKDAYAAAWRNLVRAHADNMTDVMRSESTKVTGRKAPKRIVDKLLTNYKNIGIIHLLFPKAVIIHIFRDPRDTILSLMKHNFAHPSLGWTLSDANILAEYKHYLSLMSHFKKVLPAGRILEVRYENMISEPDAVFRKIFGRIGVKWDKTVLEQFNKVNKPYILTPSFLQIREGLNNRSIGIWRNYIRNPVFYNLIQKIKIILEEEDVTHHGLPTSFSETSGWDQELNSVLLS